METWLTTLLELVTAAGAADLSTHLRDDLLEALFAPLGADDAHRYAVTIAGYADEIRFSAHQTRADRELASAVTAAVLQVQNTFTPGLQAAA